MKIINKNTFYCHPERINHVKVFNYTNLEIIIHETFVFGHTFISKNKVNYDDLVGIWRTKKLKNDRQI